MRRATLHQLARRFPNRNLGAKLPPAWKGRGKPERMSVKVASEAYPVRSYNSGTAVSEALTDSAEGHHLAYSPGFCFSTWLLKFESIGIS